MSQFSRISSTLGAREIDYSRYACPVCGQTNGINSSECPRCQSELLEYEEHRYSRWNLFNEALADAKEGRLVGALEKLSVFLDRYPEDRVAGRLRLLLMRDLKDPRFEIELDAFIQQKNDRWATMLQDEPDSLSFEDIREKPRFEGRLLTGPQPTPVETVRLTELENLWKLVDVINPLFDIHSKNGDKSRRRKGRVKEEFEHFYETGFALYLARSGIEVVDYVGGCFDELPEERQGGVGRVELVNKRGVGEGVVTRSLQPEIRYRGAIVQKAVLEVNRKNMGKESRNG